MYVYVCVCTSENKCSNLPPWWTWKVRKTNRSYYKPSGDMLMDRNWDEPGLGWYAAGSERLSVEPFHATITHYIPSRPAETENPDMHFWSLPITRQRTAERGEAAFKYSGFISARQHHHHHHRHQHHFQHPTARRIIHVEPGDVTSVASSLQTSLNHFGKFVVSGENKQTSSSEQLKTMSSAFPRNEVMLPELEISM